MCPDFAFLSEVAHHAYNGAVELGHQHLNQSGMPKVHPGEQLVSEQQWQEIGNRLNLSGRELQVCRSLFLGKTRQQTATDLNVKPRTVRHHMESIHEKMKVHNRVGVVLRVIQVRDLI